LSNKSKQKGPNLVELAAAEKVKDIKINLRSFDRCAAEIKKLLDEHGEKDARDAKTEFSLAFDSFRGNTSKLCRAFNYFCFFMNDKGQAASVDYHTLKETLDAFTTEWNKHMRVLDKPRAYHDLFITSMLIEDLLVCLKPVRPLLDEKFK
jgi:hypothetical protein